MILAATIAIVIAAIIRAICERKNIATRFFSALFRIELAVIGLLLFTLVVIGCAQILLRNVFHSGLLWADPLMRHIVLWLGCLSGGVATAKLRHINIDAVTRVLPEKLKPVRNAIVYAATAVAAYFLAVAALQLVIDEKSFGDTAFWGLQTWHLQTVLPFAFFLIAYRSLVHLLILKPAPTEPQ